MILGSVSEKAVLRTLMKWSPAFLNRSVMYIFSDLAVCVFDSGSTVLRETFAHKHPTPKNGPEMS